MTEAASVEEEVVSIEDSIEVDLEEEEVVMIGVDLEAEEVDLTEADSEVEEVDSEGGEADMIEVDTIVITSTTEVDHTIVKDLQPVFNLHQLRIKYV